VKGDRIVFMGTPEFAVASLDALVSGGIEVAAAVTAPDRPAGRGLRPRAPAVKEHALALGLPVLQPADLRDPAFLQVLDRCDASLYVVVAFRKLPREVFGRPAKGCINLHASLLPDYRGAAPINWAVINGERRTGVTTFFIQERIDTGDMIHQEATAIGPNETAGELHDRLMRLGARLVARTVREVIAGSATRIPQPVPADGLHAAPKLTPERCRIAWDRPVRSVHDHIRGLSPVPGAWCSWNEGAASAMHFKVLGARPGEASAPAVPGSVRVEAGRLCVACADGWIELLEVQPAGRKRMTASEFIRGHRTLEHIRLT